ncbi:MAG TPA: acetyl/propionyl/methylcrotonyl-CoA carboxylase subunit alpha [Stellaceae bacterium]|nr:acetyl/propionyl/methylcrotonyl-CoA carboxylase subunit alpha [Stellaceae bacterium]
MSKLFSKILVANRGEIACRVMRTAKRLGIATVAVYSEADAGALHVAMADEAIPIGPPPARESYLDIARIIAAAKQSGAEAIHPGYGFLSENADFAAACEAAGIAFIGPPAAAIRAMGSKAEAKALMTKAGVPLVPGYHGTEQSDARLIKEAKAIGLPVLLKASAGGGGKGMRIVQAESELVEAVAGARRESKAAFGDDRLLIEKYLIDPRHIEMQVFADSHGNVVHLFERDCSIQRRHQKLIEEAPAPDLSDAQRQELAKIAVNAARAVDYRGAGTIELVSADGKFYFIEMNTRLQVEHVATEMITGLDLVEWQIRVAAGEPLPLKQDAILRRGHAIEARLYAEDPARDYLPSAGALALLRFPEPSDTLRVETGFRQGDRIGTYYDALIAKLIAWGETRDKALQRLGAALAETRIAGVVTNRELLLRIAMHPDFAAQAGDTGFIARHYDTLLSAPDSRQAAIAAALSVLNEKPLAPADPYSPWQQRDGWRIGEAARASFRFRFGDRTHEVRIAGNRRAVDGDVIEAPVDAAVTRLGNEFWIVTPDATTRLTYLDPLAPGEQSAANAGKIVAPMPGKVTAVLVAPGAAVTRGQRLMLIEAMKMEHAIIAPADGIIAAIHFAPGALVEEGVELLTLESTRTP